MNWHKFPSPLGLLVVTIFLSGVAMIAAALIRAS